ETSRERASRRGLGPMLYFLCSIPIRKRIKGASSPDKMSSRRTCHAAWAWDEPSLSSSASTVALSRLLILVRLIQRMCHRAFERSTGKAVFTDGLEARDPSHCDAAARVLRLILLDNGDHSVQWSNPH